MNYITDFSYIDDLIDNKGVRNAVIDVDNTITKSNIVQFYLFIKTRNWRKVVAPILFNICSPCPIFFSIGCRVTGFI